MEINVTTLACSGPSCNVPRMPKQTCVILGKRGQVQFVRSILRAVPANWTRPLFPPDWKQNKTLGTRLAMDRGRARLL